MEGENLVEAAMDAIETPLLTIGVSSAIDTPLLKIGASSSPMTSAVSGGGELLYKLRSAGGLRSRRTVR